jgi:hypothetical protein
MKVFFSLRFDLLGVLTVFVAANYSHCSAADLVTRAHLPSRTGAGNSAAPVFNEDGRYLAFLSHANNR